MKLTIEVQGGPFHPGDTVGGTLHVAEDGRSRSLAVALAYRERTADYSAVATAVTTGPLTEGDLTPGQAVPFSLALPSDALPGLSGPNGSLGWELEARSDELGLDTTARLPVPVLARPRR